MELSRGFLNFDFIFCDRESSGGATYKEHYYLFLHAIYIYISILGAEGFFTLARENPRGKIRAELAEIAPLLNY